MRRALLIIMCAAWTLVLSGCGSLFSGHWDMEHLRPVQAAGLDAEEDGAVTLSVCTGAGPGDEDPLALRGTASGIEAAADRLQDWAPGDELFYAHIRWLLLGEDMAGNGLGRTMDWVERSPAMRMETPLFIVRGRADVLLEQPNAAESLASLEREEKVRGGNPPTLRQAAAGVLERGWALCLAVEVVPTEGTVMASDGAAVVPAGLALLREGQPPVFLSRNEALGAALMDRSVDGTHVPLDGSEVELFGGGGAKAEGLWTGRTLTGLRIRCELQAGILERKSDADDRTVLTDRLAETLTACLTDAVRLSQALGCDFLGLEDAVRASAPDRSAARALDWDAVFPALPVTVTVEADVGREYDLVE